MKAFSNRKIYTPCLLVFAFALGVACTLLIGAVPVERKAGVDFNREEEPILNAVTEAIEKFQNEAGTEELTFTKNEIWDLVELSYWFGVYSHTVNNGILTSYYDFILRDPRERGNSRAVHMDKFISEQCEIQTNRLAIEMRKKFEANTPEFKAIFGEMQKLLSVRADAQAPRVVCPFDEAGVDLYDTEDSEDEDL
ncbi:MAG: hypothetical protein F4Z01_03010 [Gammaproteobacteria bacterium]|nr:hypothetical protein [Gammaproteobacteria bacterium]MYF37639.1 hypothetical protein [Gammaproteobacteria bacterium]